MITIKTQREMDLMREAGRIVGRCLAWVGETVAPGVSTLQLDEGVEAIIREAGGTPEFLGYPKPGSKPFPASICASINEEVVHGLPSSDRILADGDIISVDVGVRRKNYIGDAARTFAVGAVDDESKRLLAATSQCLQAAIDTIRPGIKLEEVSRAIESVAQEHGFGDGIVKEYAGHGLGSEMHEDPQVLNYYDPKGAFNDRVLTAGMTLAIEPMLNAGTWKTKEDSDGWTVKTRDGKRSAHFEHSLGITDDGVLVLTEL